MMKRFVLITSILCASIISFAAPYSSGGYGDYGSYDDYEENYDYYGGNYGSSQSTDINYLLGSGTAEDPWLFGDDWGAGDQPHEGGPEDAGIFTKNDGSGFNVGDWIIIEGEKFELIADARYPGYLVLRSEDGTTIYGPSDDVGDLGSSLGSFLLPISDSLWLPLLMLLAYSLYILLPRRQKTV